MPGTTPHNLRGRDAKSDAATLNRAMRPPPSFTTVSRLKQRYGDPDLVVPKLAPLKSRSQVGNPDQRRLQQAAIRKQAEIKEFLQEEKMIGSRVSSIVREQEPDVQKEEEPVAAAPLPAPSVAPGHTVANSKWGKEEASSPTKTEEAAPKPKVPLILVRGDYYSATSPPSTKADDYKAAVSELDSTLKSFAPLELTSSPTHPIQKAVAWMRKEKDQAILKDKSLTPSAEMAHDLRLLRFLIGSKFDPVKATDEYISALKKRRDLKLDSLRDQVRV